MQRIGENNKESVFRLFAKRKVSRLPSPLKSGVQACRYVRISTRGSEISLVRKGGVNGVWTTG
jgi:hypothetical protein